MAVHSTFPAEASAILEALTEKLSKAHIEAPEAIAKAMITGFSEGVIAMDAQRGNRLTEEGFFDYRDIDGALHRVDARLYLRRLPALLDELSLHEDAEHARRILAKNSSDPAAALRRILAESETGLDGVRAALINYHRDLSAKLLGEHAVDPSHLFLPDERRGADDGSAYRSLTSADYTAIQLARAADYLIAGKPLIGENQLEDAALQLGYTSGAAQEALRQAIEAFDHEAYRQANQYDDDWIVGTASILGSILGVIVVFHRYDVLGISLAADLTMLQFLNIFLPALFAALGAGVVIFFLLSLCAVPHPEKKHNLIAKEAADRARNLSPCEPPVRYLADCPAYETDGNSGCKEGCEEGCEDGEVPDGDGDLFETAAEETEC